MCLSFAKKVLLFTKKIDFLNIRYKNCTLFQFWIVFLPLFFPFSLPFYSRYLLHCIFFLPAVKRWVLIMGKVRSLAKSRNKTLINNSYNGPFYHHFCTKTDNLAFQFATSCSRYPKLTCTDFPFINNYWMRW